MSKLKLCLTGEFEDRPDSIKQRLEEAGHEVVDIAYQDLDYIIVGANVKFATKKMGKAFNDGVPMLSEYGVHKLIPEKPYVSAHVGAELLFMDNVEVEVMLVGSNDEVCIKQNNGDLSVCLSEELKPRKSAHDVLVDEMVDCINTHKASFIPELVKEICDDLIKAGYCK